MKGTTGRATTIGEPTNFLIGCALNPTAQNLDLELERFEKKLEAGADFVMTQPLYDMETLLRTLERVGKVEVPVLLGVMPLQSSRHAEYLHNEVPGITIPGWAGSGCVEPASTGCRRGSRWRGSSSRRPDHCVQGVYLMPSFGRFEQVAEILR